MPRPAKGARLWLEPEERDAEGKLVRRASWVIRDGTRKIRTGCARKDRAGAERALAEYIASKYQVPRDRGPSSLSNPRPGRAEHLSDRQGARSIRVRTIPSSA